MRPGLLCFNYSSCQKKKITSILMAGAADRGALVGCEEQVEEEGGGGGGRKEGERDTEPGSRDPTDGLILTHLPPVHLLSTPALAPWSHVSRKNVLCSSVRGLEGRWRTGVGGIGQGSVVCPALGV